MAPPLFGLTPQQAAHMLNATFTVETQKGEFPLVLMHTKEHPRLNLPERFRTPLSLIFVGPYSPRLSADTYVFNHPIMGRHEWFVSPVSYSETGRASGMPPAPGQPIHYEVMFA